MKPDMKAEAGEAGEPMKSENRDRGARASVCSGKGDTLLESAIMIVHSPEVTGQDSIQVVCQMPLKNVAKTPPEKDLRWGAFVNSAWSDMMKLDAQVHGAMLGGATSFLVYQARSISSSPFDLQNGNSPHLLLSCGEAFPRFSPELAHITKFISWVFLILILLWQLQLAMKIIFLLIVISETHNYFTELARKASGVVVHCGSFNLPLILYALLCGLGLSLIAGLVTVLVVYFSWRYREKRALELKKVNIGEDVAAGTLGG